MMKDVYVLPKLMMHMRLNIHQGFSNTNFPSNPSRDEGAGQIMTAGKQDGASQPQESLMPRSHTADSGIGSSQGNPEDSGPAVEDVLGHMAPKDKYGLKGLSYMLNNYPDYNAMMTGIDINSFGLDLTSRE